MEGEGNTPASSGGLVQGFDVATGLGCCLAIFKSLHTHTHKYILLPLLLLIIIITGLCQETKAKPDVHGTNGPN